MATPLFNDDGTDDFLADSCVLRTSFNAENNYDNSHSHENDIANGHGNEFSEVASPISNNCDNNNQQSDNNRKTPQNEFTISQNHRIQNHLTIHKSKSSPSITADLAVAAMGNSKSRSSSQRSRWNGATASFTNEDSKCDSSFLTRRHSEENIQVSTPSEITPTWESRESNDHERSIKHFCTLRTKKNKFSDGKTKSSGAEKYGSLKLREKIVLSEYLRTLDKEKYDSDDKILEYLSELDAYLDEMQYNHEDADDSDSSQEDGDCGATCIQQFFDSFNENGKQNDEQLLIPLATTSAATITESAAQSTVCPDVQDKDRTSDRTSVKCPFNLVKLKLHNKYCSLPKRMKLNHSDQIAVGDSDALLNLSDGRSENSDNLKRNSLLRRTIMPVLKDDKRGDHTISSKRINQVQDTPRRQLSWIRNSMRKTCPIPLPEQVEGPSTSKDNRNAIQTPLTTALATTTAVNNKSEHNNFHGNALVDTNLTASISASVSSERLHTINMNRKKLNKVNDDFKSFNIVQFSNQLEGHNRTTGNGLLSAMISNDLSQFSTATEAITHPTSTATSTSSASANVPAGLPQAAGTNYSLESMVPSINSSPNSNFNNMNLNNSFIDVDILNTLLLNSNNNNTAETASDSMENRPRQMGRRSEFRPRLIAINTTEQRIITSHNRPNSAPARVALRQPRFMSSEPSSVGSSRNPSPVSLISSSASSSTATSVIDNNESHRNNNNNAPTPIHQMNNLDSNNGDHQDDGDNKYKKWPHVFSRSLACTCCTLGLFNISRFAIFSIHFGANFIVQFLIFSMLFGVPLIWLQMSLGAKIQGGPVRMWRISPICKGIGISLLIGQGLMAMYSAVSLTWILVYFRDSFVTRNDRYRWQESYELYRGPLYNQSIKLTDTIADYFNGIVLQRLQLGPGGRAGVHGMGAVRFQLAFNLALIWTLIFIVLCKNVRSFGKIVIGLFLTPLLGLIALCCKFLTIINFDSLQNIFPATDWQDFFLNSRSWMCAAQETFLTWGLLGVSIYTLTCKSNGANFNKTEIRRDAFLVVLITLLGLLLAAILGNACVQILTDKGYYYFSGSYENIGSNVFLLPSEQPLPPQLASTPSKWLPRYSTLLGESFKRPGISPSIQSGYQVLRLVTELFPATLAAATHNVLMPFWSFLGFSTFFLFGISQLCAMWMPIAGALGESPSSVLLSCVTGIFLGIPLATESGITIIHFLDKVIGGAWWLIILWIGHILAVFLVRGRPYTSDVLVNDLHLTQTFSAFIAFAWNVLLPVGLMFLCILEYRVSNANEFFHWRGNNNYWPLWVRQTAGFIQISLLLLVPLISIIQIYRYLSKGPPDILERVELLYRPPLTSENTTSSITHRRPQAPLPPNATIISLDTRQQQDDAPPKYTPPPSYTTATGARIAKMLRNSIRRSVRRIMGESSGNRRLRTLNTNSNVRPASDNPPPDYSSVLVDPNGNYGNNQNENMRNTIASIEMGPRILYNSETQGRRRSVNSETNSQSLTASDVAQFLRPSRVISFNRASSLGGNVDQMIRSSLNRRHSRSVENLVLAAAPIGESSIIHLNRDEDGDNNNNAGEIDSVI